MNGSVFVEWVSGWEYVCRVGGWMGGWECVQSGWVDGSVCVEWLVI